MRDIVCIQYWRLPCKISLCNYESVPLHFEGVFWSQSTRSRFLYYFYKHLCPCQVGIDTLLFMMIINYSTTLNILLRPEFLSHWSFYFNMVDLFVPWSSEMHPRTILIWISLLFIGGLAWWIFIGRIFNTFWNHSFEIKARLTLIIDILNTLYHWIYSIY